MISERYQVTAVPIEGGGRIQGYYCYVGWTRQQKHYIVPEYASAFYGKEIDPATIEPVRVKPIFVPNGCCPDALYCPNCNYDLMGGVEADAEHDPPYCWECGMALDWPKRSQSGWPDKED